MHIKLRQKPGGRLEVLDDRGRPVKGVRHLELASAPDGTLVVRLTIAAPEVVIDTEAEVTTVAPPPPPPDDDGIMRKGL